MTDFHQYETPDGRIDLSWGFNGHNDRPSSQPMGGIGCMILVEDPYRESSGHSASLGPVEARAMAAELLAYAEAEEARDLTFAS